MPWFDKVTTIRHLPGPGGLICQTTGQRHNPMRSDFFFRNRWFLAIVVLPTLLAIVYYGVIASDQYVSESRFVVKNRSDRPNPGAGIASILAGTGMSMGQEQTNEVMEYMRSRDALSDLQKKIDVKKVYSTPTADFLARYDTFWRRDLFENLYDYYTHRVEVHVDAKTAVAVLEVRAFSAADAQAINGRLLDLGEELVNRLNIKANENAIVEARRRVSVAEDRARRARVAMAQYRNKEALLDPKAQGAGVLEIAAKLSAEQAALQSQLEVMQRVTPNNPAIAALQGQIAAIGRQIEVQNQRAAGTQSALASKLVGYENLLAEQEFATQALTAASASLEQAQTEAARQQYYLARIVEPNRPDWAAMPRRIIQILTVAAIALCVFLICWMLAIGILEHAPED